MRRLTRWLPLVAVLLGIGAALPADAKPLQVNHLPSHHQGEVVRGSRTNRVRCSTYEMEFPEVPTGASFFSQQAKAMAPDGATERRPL